MTNFKENTAHIARTTDYLKRRFPNGSTVVVRHYNRHKETWAGGFSKNTDEDKEALALHPLPPDDLQLSGFKVNGHEVDFQGKLTIGFRFDEKKELIAFQEQLCNAVRIDGKTFRFSERPLKKNVFAPSLSKDTLETFIWAQGENQVSIPMSQISSYISTLKNTEEKSIKHKIIDDSIRF